MAKDLRSFLKDAEAAGMLYTVQKEVDPRANVGALCDEADRAIMFENVKGFPGARVVSNLAVSRDMDRVIFGVKDRSAVVRAVAAAMDKGPAPHNVVESGPCQEVIWEGDDASLLRLPIVQHSELDGGPYIGSAIGVFVDPETGIHNTTWPRVQMGNGRECPFMVFSPHVSRIMGKYAKLGKPMPMALVIGVHPAVDVAASISIHHPHCGELDFASALLGEQMDFVRCGTVPIDVPAHAEIVIEGEVIPNYVQDEGPFGNYLGTYSTGPISRDGIQKAPVMRIKRITMRKDAIYRHLQSTVWTEHQRLCMLPMEGVFFNALTEMGINCHDVYMPSWGGCALTLIQMTPRAQGEAQDALLKATLWENTTLSFMSHVAIAVNKDVDIYDARDVMWAQSIRTNWAQDVRCIPNTRSSPLMPVSHKVAGAPWRMAGKGLIDATILPAKDDGEWWDQSRAWPLGKGKVSLSDFVSTANGSEPVMQRLITLDEAVATKPGARKPSLPEGLR
jgi:2,5-furandicarboxylate decarboxylase 1